VARSLFVPRKSCAAGHFLRQRVRQAYDDFAQPARLALELSLLPGVLFGRRRWPLLPLAAAAAAAGLAEAGRRRAGGTRVFPASSALWAPAWLLERSVSIWVALGFRLAGGIPYAGERITTAAHSRRFLRRRFASGQGVHSGRGGAGNSAAPVRLGAAPAA